MLKIIATFVNFKYDPEQIDLIHAWDEYSIDSNPQGYTESLEKEIASYQNEIDQKHTVEIVVPYTEISKLFETPQIAGEVRPA